MSAAQLMPADRLALSRERLHQAMRDISAPQGGAKNQCADGLTGAWQVGLRSNPVTNVVIEAVSSWWAKHPLRTTSMLAADALKTVVQPVAQRHPLGLLVGAFLLGGLLARSLPWRRIVTPVLFAGLLPQLLSKAMAQVPPQSWMVVLTSLAQQQRRPKKPVQQAGSTANPSHTPAS